jgi:hypothetical protein
MTRFSRQEKINHLISQSKISENELDKFQEKQLHQKVAFLEDEIKKMQKLLLIVTTSVMGEDLSLISNILLDEQKYSGFEIPSKTIDKLIKNIKFIPKDF